MFRHYNTIPAALLIIAATLITEAKGEHAYDQQQLLAAACKLKDTACSFEKIICNRPVASYYVHVTKLFRQSAEQLHESIRCEASPWHVKANFSRMCAYSRLIDRRLVRSCGFRADRELVETWRCVLADLEAVECLIDGRPLNAPVQPHGGIGPAAVPFHAEPIRQHATRHEPHDPASERPLREDRARTELLEALIRSLLR